MTSRSSPWRGRGAVMIALILVMGSVLLGTGISNVLHAGQIAAHGVAVPAAVAQNHGFGRYSVLVRYAIASGRPQEGVLNTPSQAASYRVGSPLTVVYDPASPTIVTLPGSGSGGGWAEIVIGSLLLGLLAFVAARSWQRGRRGAVPGPVV